MKTKDLVPIWWAIFSMLFHVSGFQVFSDYARTFPALVYYDSNYINTRKGHNSVWICLLSQHGDAVDCPASRLSCCIQL